MIKILKLGFILVVLMTIAAGTGGYLYWEGLKTYGETTLGNDGVVDVVISKGTNPKAVARILQEKDIIKDPQRFYRFARYIAKEAHKVKAGEYLIDRSITPRELLKALQTGKRKEIPFTIPEGSSKIDIAKIIAAAGFGSEITLNTLMEDASLIKSFGVPERGADGQDSVPGGLEGYLFPDTYQFPKDTPIKTILKKMNARLKEVLDDDMMKRMKRMNWTLHKTLTLAAIIEKETGKSFERPHISSVFHNRIKKGMKMQTDPTVIYGIKSYDGNIRRKDLKAYHPYNTYRIKGLPPGPIASPGKAAIKAALWPDTTDDIFFVSRNDGTHIFCPTLECHNRNVRKWQVEYFRKKKAKK